MVLVIGRGWPWALYRMPWAQRLHPPWCALQTQLTGSCPGSCNAVLCTMMCTFGPVTDTRLVVSDSSGDLHLQNFSDLSVLPCATVRFDYILTWLRCCVQGGDDLAIQLQQDEAFARQAQFLAAHGFGAFSRFHVGHHSFVPNAFGPICSCCVSWYTALYEVTTICSAVGQRLSRLTCMRTEWRQAPVKTCSWQPKVTSIFQKPSPTQT